MTPYVGGIDMVRGVLEARQEYAQMKALVNFARHQWDEQNAGLLQKMKEVQDVMAEREAALRQSSIEI